MRTEEKTCLSLHARRTNSCYSPSVFPLPLFAFFCLCAALIFDCTRMCSIKISDEGISSARACVCAVDTRGRRLYSQVRLREMAINMYKDDTHTIRRSSSSKSTPEYKERTQRTPRIKQAHRLYGATIYNQTEKGTTGIGRKAEKRARRNELVKRMPVHKLVMNK